MNTVLLFWTFSFCNIIVHHCSSALATIKLTYVVQDFTQNLIEHKYPKYKVQVWKMMVQIQRPLTNDLCNITMIRTVRCTVFTRLIHLVLVSLSLSAWAVQAHTSPYCAASRHAIDFALLCYHLLFLTFPSQRACRIYFLLTSCLFSLYCVPLQWGLGILYCLSYSTILSICFRQVITLALLPSLSFSFTLFYSSAIYPLVLTIFFYIFLLIPSCLLLFITSMWSSLSSCLLSLPLPLLCLSSGAVRESYFVPGNPVSKAHLHDYAALLLIGSGEIILPERDVSDWNGPQSNKITLPIPNFKFIHFRSEQAPLQSSSDSINIFPSYSGLE